MPQWLKDIWPQTLIEWMIISAIVAILIAIAAPKFAKMMTADDGVIPEASAVPSSLPDTGKIPHTALQHKYDVYIFGVDQYGAKSVGKIYEASDAMAFDSGWKVTLLNGEDVYMSGNVIFRGAGK